VKSRADYIPKEDGMTAVQAVNYLAETTTGEELADEFQAAAEKIGEVCEIDSLTSFVHLAAVAIRRVKVLEAGR
jgi:hypothetical protein